MNIDDYKTYHWSVFTLSKSFSHSRLNCIESGSLDWIYSAVNVNCTLLMHLQTL